METSLEIWPVFLAPMVIESLPSYQPEHSETVELYKRLLIQAQAFASPVVSGRQVGAIAIGLSGRAYLGANIEIKGAAPSDTIHAETFAITLARSHGEKGLKAMVQTLQPCGSCRQILAEAGSPELSVHILDPQTGNYAEETIENLFPRSYSYATALVNLFLHPELVIPQTEPGLCPDTFPLFNSALTSAKQGYQPHATRKTWSGLAARLKNGKVYTGSAITISGPNPTITPVQDLLIRLTAHGESASDIQHVHMIEPQQPDYSFFKNSEAVLEKIAPRATIHKSQA